VQRCPERERLLKAFAQAEEKWISLMRDRDCLHSSGLTKQQIADLFARVSDARLAADRAVIEHAEKARLAATVTDSSDGSPRKQASTIAVVMGVGIRDVSCLTLPNLKRKL